MDLLRHDDERVRKVVEARLAVKSTIAITRAQRLRRLAEFGQATPAPLTFSGAVQTHRFSGSDGLNFQNLPKKSFYFDKKKGWHKGPSRIRKAVCPPPGFKCVVVDSSNIELRMCHWMARSPKVFELIKAGRDPYCEFAGEVYGKEVNPKAYEEGSPEHEEHSRMRTIGKIALLALQYGMGPGKYIDTVWDWTGILLDATEAEMVVQKFRTAYPQIKSLWHALDSALRLQAKGLNAPVPMGFNLPITFETVEDPHLPGTEFRIVLPGGLALKYPKLEWLEEEQQLRFFKRLKRKVSDPWDYTWGGKVTENITQALASQVIREQMTRIERRFEEAGIKQEAARHGRHPRASLLVLQVHDEVVAMVPEERAEEAKAIMIEEMSITPAWANGLLVLGAEGAVADTYGDAK